MIDKPMHSWRIVCCLILFLWLGTQQSIAQSGTPLLSCRLNVPSIAVGGQAELLLEIQNVQNFYGYELTLGYDPNIVEILDGDPNREQVNAQLGNFLSPDFLMLNEINQPGELLLNLMQIDPTPARSGNGLLARIALIGRGAGTANFTLADVLLYDANGEEMASQLQPCSLQIGDDAGPTPTATATLPTATPSPTVTPTSEPPTTTATPTTEIPVTATASPLPATEPTLAPPTATATAPAAMSSDTPTPTATAMPILPTATLAVNLATGGAVSVPPELPSPIPSVGDAIAPTVPVAPTPTPQVAHNSVDATAPAGNASTAPAAGHASATDASLPALFLPYISAGDDTPRTQQETSVETGWSQPLNQVNSLSSPLSAAGPIALIDLYLVILLLGIFAVGAVGLGLLVLIAYMLFVRLRLSPRARFVHPSRLRSGYTRL